MSDVIENILSTARRKGKNQKTLLQLAGLHKSTLSRIRRGKSKPRMSTLKRLIEAANV